jgi:hypothetical protein
MVTHDLDWLWTPEGLAALARLQGKRVPLVMKWTEFGWEKLTGRAINKFDPELFDRLSRRFRVTYVTVEEYLDVQGARGAAPLPSVRLAMDDFAKLLPWGIGGDQLRRFGREVEAVLLAAERFEAAAHVLGTGVDGAGRLRQAWRDLLCAQSHDVSLCEFTRRQGAMPPAEPRIDAHFQTWGSHGYRMMDDAMAAGREVLDGSLRALAAAAGAGTGDGLAAWIFNPAAFEGTPVVSTGMLHLEDLGWRSVGVRDRSGARIPAQVIASERTAAGALACAELIFPAPRLPSIGVEVFRLGEETGGGAGPGTDLAVDESGLELRNGLVAVTLDPSSGAIRSLRDLATGLETIDPRRPFPSLSGRPNGEVLPRRHATGIPDSYDSAKMPATFTWLEKGPVRARVRVSYPPVRGMRLEFTVGLVAGSPEVEVQFRLFPDMPPRPGEGRVNGWQFPLEVEEGYWLELAPGFEPATVLRDYPFGIEPCRKTAIEALTWLDLLGADGGGLMLIHSGAQYFRRRPDGIVANLILREWESHFTGEFGWPRAVIHRYVLIPHGAPLTHRERVCAAKRFDQKPRCVAARAPRELPPPRSFVEVAGDGAVVSAVRRDGDDVEVRVVECAGEPARARLRTSLPLASIRRTDALGRGEGESAVLKEDAPMELRAWEIRTCRLGR